MDGLSRLFDIGPAFAPVDMSVGTNTGLRLNLRAARSVAILFVKGAGTAAQDPVLSLSEHTAASGGTTQAMNGLTRYYRKSATTLANTETWAKVTIPSAPVSTVTLTGEAAKAGCYLFPVESGALDAGFNYLSFSVADVGANAQIGTALYIVHDMEVNRAAEKLPALLT